jgi:uncharacterized protein
MSEAEKLPASAYTDDVNARVYAALADKARRIVAAGHSVIVDAVFAQPAERAAIAEAAKSARLTLQGLFLTADTASRLARVGGRIGDASDADAAVARAQEHYDLGLLQWDKIDASGTPEATLARTKAALPRP